VVRQRGGRPPLHRLHPQHRGSTNSARPYPSTGRRSTCAASSATGSPPGRTARPR
jgi:hypothetical protein